LLTLARDAVIKKHDSEDPRMISVCDFMAELFKLPSLNESPRTSSMPLEEEGVKTPPNFGQDFKNAKMHFNHFIKVHQFDVIGRRYLSAFLARGAAILCANCQAGIDILIPFVHDEDVPLKDTNIGFILVQVKNNMAVTANLSDDLFESMDPYKLGILNEDDKNERLIPMIRILFSLATRTPTVRVRDRVSTDAGFNSYDIWSAGLSNKFLKPVSSHEQDTWDTLLQASKGWEDVYRTDPRNLLAEQLRRTTYPNAARDGQHWNWVQLDEGVGDEMEE